ncbi:acyl carrier protein [Campylobacter pinnipediorum]|uniref:acyl carrier protein n=1 Tax=Campylobacter pinnipediorum TaxID=1965231 RepID=UPI0009950940|nr:acyl carrier protein [Campylobacter pinnipediorum]AQW83678.1 hypothetical protein CPIN17261_1694 [Campylobacter pinnipediorum subsp. pinnipediorum]
MNLNNKMELIAELLDLKTSDFKSETILSELDEWDSMAAISYVVMMDEKFGKIIDTKDIKNFKTIQDILDSME